jgi:hypothetical protein
MSTELDFHLMDLADQISEAIENLNLILESQPESNGEVEPITDHPPVHLRKKRRKRRKQGKKGDVEIPRSLISHQNNPTKQPLTSNTTTTPSTNPTYRMIWKEEDFPPLVPRHSQGRKANIRDTPVPNNNSNGPG